MLTDRLATWAADNTDDAAVTYVDHSTSLDGLSVTATWGTLHRRVASTAAALRRVTGPGTRVVVLAPQGVDDVVAMLAALWAGVVAVPLDLADLDDHPSHVTAVLADCLATAVLTTTAAKPRVQDFVDVPVVLVDAMPDDAIDRYPVVADDVAMLRYPVDPGTDPVGTPLSHGDLAAAGARAVTAFRAVTGRSVTVSWLPLCHDLGFVLAVAAPLTARLRAVLLEQSSVLEQPRRWLQALASGQDVITAAPDFALAYCASRTTEQDRSWLRLSQVSTMLDGGEPINASTVRVAVDVFGQCGLQPKALRTCYGATGTVGPVTMTSMSEPPRRLTVDREQLAAGKAVPRTDGRATPLVSSGMPLDGAVLVVDPGASWPLPDGMVGEIWVTGTAVAVRQELVELDGRSWLRTGDLGFLHEGELFVLGRQEDLLTVDGRRLDPHEVELVARAAHPTVRPDRVVALSFGEAVVIVAERSQHVPPDEVDLTAVVDTVRAAVSKRFAVPVRDVVIVESGRMPAGWSGRPTRAAIRRRYLDGEL
ncbi:AMP-binding protein [Kutzneria buriramensis]|uniref:Acyl-CoA synthetase (AMP-forming)/AMP-acid ligase II n=1 Tax=Kutzneria buriramensis TaxID=1045776 RepID=A0A3E0I610_9PSEU|nr:AMP-binding protein [Kutzneria buriramensis]REH54172.1 acyl-CoA synthetase (AMP-forming)/AMP-acid ligase II [Kutzneria buriramensis]